MWIRKVIWWLILVHSYNKISAVNNLYQEGLWTSYNTMAQIFKLCYSDRSNPIVITKNLIQIINELQVEFPVMIIDRNFKAKDIQIFIPAYPLYIVSIDSTAQLQGLLNELKSTPTWNIVSTFFLIETAENNCQNASQVLQLLWKFDLLSSFYFCIDDPNNDIMLFTYNPYTSRAPDSWTKVDTDDKPDNPWTLYKQLYTPNDTKICQTIDYDKTNSLDGYEIKATGDSLTKKNITQNKIYGISSFEYSLVNTEKMFMVSLFSALNVTPLISYDDYGSYVNNSARGFLKSLVNHTHDISVVFRRRAAAIQVVDGVNLHYQNGLLILTQNRPFEIPVDKVSDFFDIRPAVALFVGVMTVTFITIVLNTDNDYVQAFLDILRMILGFGILAPFQRFSMRICFALSFMVIFIMNPAMQGQISSFLSKPDQRNIESLKDVYDQQYKLRYLPSNELYILDQNLWSIPSDSKFLDPNESTYWGCSEYVLADSSAACLSFSELQIRDALKHNLHVTKTFDRKFYITFWVRKNWPLKSRVDQIASKMTEAGLLNHWDKPKIHWPLEKIKAQKSSNSFSQFEQFGPENMLLAYAFFLLTTVLALIVFGVELLLKKFQPPRQLELQQRIVIFNRKVHVINEWV